MGARESPVVTGCMKVLVHLGIPYMRNNSGAALVQWGGKMVPMSFGKKGWPDIIGVLEGGRFLGVECKKPDDPVTGRRSHLSREQKAVMAELVKAGALWLTVRSPAEMCKDLAAEGYYRDQLREYA